MLIQFDTYSYRVRQQNHQPASNWPKQQSADTSIAQSQNSILRIKK